MSIVLLAGCGSGHDALTADGSYPVKIRTVYTPERYCAQVDDEKAKEGRELDLDYRVACLGSREWDRDLVRACRDRPRSVEDLYWLYDPSTEKSAYLTCEDLHRPVPPGF